MMTCLGRGSWTCQRRTKAFGVERRKHLGTGRGIFHSKILNKDLNGLCQFGRTRVVPGGRGLRCKAEGQAPQLGSSQGRQHGGRAHAEGVASSDGGRSMMMKKEKESVVDTCESSAVVVVGEPNKEEGGWVRKGPQEMHSVAVSAAGVQRLRKRYSSGEHLRFFVLGGLAAAGSIYVVRFIGTLPVIQNLVKRFIWWGESKEPSKPRETEVNDVGVSIKETNDAETRALMALATGDSEDSQEKGEPVEWVNMCWRKAWRVYQRGLERWLADLLQPVFDSLVADKMVPAFVQKLRITEFTLDHEAPYFTNMRRRNSRKDSDLNGVVDVRYTGGARMVLSIDIGTGRYRLKVPVMVSDLDLECRLWLKLRLAPMCPYVGTLSLAFVGPPTIKVQLSPYDRIKLMRIPVIQPFLTKLFTVDLPQLMTLPQRMEIVIPPAVTAVAEAAIGRDAVMRAVASAVLQADALEHALISALPLGPQGAAGGISLPDLFRGELQVTLKAARELPVWGFPWQSNPYCRLALGSQAVRSRKDNETSQKSRHGAPVWNQEFQFLVEDPSVQELELWIMDSPITGRTDVAYAKLTLTDLPSDGILDAWFPLTSSMPAEKSGGSVRLQLTYKPFQDDDADAGYREAAALLFEDDLQKSENIIDVKTAADASSRAAVAASAAAAAVAVTKAAAARAAARLSRMNRSGDEEEEKEEEKEKGNSSEQGEKSHVDSKLDRTEEKSSGTTKQSENLNGSSSNGTSHNSTNAGETATTRKGREATTFNSDEDEQVVKEFSAMTETMHTLTDDVLHMHGFDDEEKLELAEKVAAAEGNAISAVVKGDVHSANEALNSIIHELEQNGVNGDSTEALVTSGSVEEDISGQEKADRALTAAKAAAKAAAAAIENPNKERLKTTQQEKDVALTDSEEAWGTDATPSTPKLPVLEEEEALLMQKNQDSSGQWWTHPINWVSGWFKPNTESKEVNAVSDSDGSAAWFGRENLSPEERRKLPVGDIVLGEDIPIEEIAAEVQKSWKLRDYHVESLVQKVCVDLHRHEILTVTCTSSSSFLQQ